MSFIKRKQAVSPPSSPPAFPTPKSVKRQRTVLTPTNSPRVKKMLLGKENTTILEKPRRIPIKEKKPVPVLRVKRLSKDAKLPTRGSPGAAGYDLYW